MAKKSLQIIKKCDLGQKTGSKPNFWLDFHLNHIKKGLSTLFLALYISSLCAQDTDAQSEAELIVQRLIEDFTESNDGIAEFDFNTLYEDLISAYEQKIDINKATVTDLNQLIFLSAEDVEAILAYRKNQGVFMSIYELQAVPGLSFEKISNLRHFISIESKSSISNQKRAYNVDELKDGKSELFLKWKFDPERRRGFKSVDGEAPSFIGDRNHIYGRYQYSSSRVRYGGIYEKDPGEAYTNGTAETGLDYLSLHYQIENPTSWISQLNVGDFAVSYGQGLIAHSAFGLGKSSFTTSIKRGRSRIRAYNSVAENLAFRGAAVQIAPSNSNLSSSAFISYIPRDGNLDFSDSTRITEFTSLQTSGLHRTTSERIDQDGVNELTAGASLTLEPLEKTRISAQVITHHYDKTFTASTRPFQLYRWSGDRLTNISIDYSTLIDGWNIYGEVARSSNGGWAHVHGVIKSLDPRLDIALLYRDYSPQYQSIYSNSFGESASTNNERGVYLGLEFRPSKQWSIRAFYDQWQNDWLRFRVDAPGTGREYLARIDYNVRRQKNYYIQYRYEQKDQNTSLVTPIDFPVPQKTHRLRLHFNHHIGGGIQLRSRIEGSLYQKDNESERGILIYQDLVRRPTGSPLSLSTRIAYFNVSDFDARIWAYENDLLLEYFTPSWSGEGLRYYVHMRYKFSSAIMGEIRWDQTKFLDREVISSGNTEIEGSFQSRIKAQIKWRF